MEQSPLHETKIHGIPSFPYSVYHGNIPEWFLSFPLHWHDHFELIYCAVGQIQVTLWGTAYVLRADDLIVILPHAVHSIEQYGTGAGEYYNIMFHPSLFQGSESDPCFEKYVLPFLNSEKSMDCFQPKGSPNRDALHPFSDRAPQGQLFEQRTFDQIQLILFTALHQSMQRRYRRRRPFRASVLQPLKKRALPCAEVL